MRWASKHLNIEDGLDVSFCRRHHWWISVNRIFSLAFLISHVPLMDFYTSTSAEYDVYLVRDANTEITKAHRTSKHFSAFCSLSLCFISFFPFWNCWYSILVSFFMLLLFFSWFFYSFWSPIKTEFFLSANYIKMKTFLPSYEFGIIEWRRTK